MPTDLANDVTKDDTLVPNGHHVRIRKGKTGFYWTIYRKKISIAVSIKRYKTKAGAKQGFRSLWCNLHMEMIDEC